MFSYFVLVMISLCYLHFVLLYNVVCCVDSVLLPYWSLQLFPVPTEYRDFVLEQVISRLFLSNLGNIGSLENVYELHYPSGKRGVNYSLITQELQNIDIIIHVEQQEALPYSLRAYHLPTDPEFANQWPWFNTGQTGGPSGLDINVVPVWIQGVTGSGSTVAVIDDGVQVTHPDLYDNIDLSISFSFVRNSHNPAPILTVSEYSHGTNCAGEIVMVTDNGQCGTGVAYKAKLGGIQFLLNDFRPSQQAVALHYRSDAIQVYSNSYGPADDGFTVGGPSFESVVAIDQATSQGRGGLGSIYVFSSGNGGADGDSCAADGFINNIHIIGVGSADQNGKQAFYDESCSGKMATTYTYNGNPHSNIDVVTTFVSDSCFRNFTGTSASAPLVSGVIALGFEVNDNLSWRDVQYLVAYTSDSSQLVGDWVTNGGGLRVSPQFGFGAIDAEAYVNRARYWKPIDKANVTQKILFDSEVSINRRSPYIIEFTMPSRNILYLEHVVFTVTFDVKPNSTDIQCYERNDFPINPLVVEHTGARRGDAQITVCSPFGTCSVLLPKRPRDFINCEGYSNWDFMSVHFWAESPVGNWTFSLTFDSDNGNAILQYLVVTMYGIQHKPRDISMSCDPSCKRINGCSAGNGSIYCDSCGDGYFRNISTMECVRSCSPGACVLEGTCVFYNGTCPEFNENSLMKYDMIIIGASIGFVGLMIILYVALTFCCLFKKHSLKRTRKHTIINDADTAGAEYFFYPDRD